MATSTTRKRAATQTAAKDTDVENDPKVQHPALAGDPAAEVARRTADGPDGEHGLTFYKTFRLLLPDEDVSDELVEVNRTRVVEEAIQRGLHPTAQPVHAGTDVVEHHRRGGVTVDLRYTVPVEPAVTDHDPADTVAPSDVHADTDTDPDDDAGKAG